MAIVKTDDTYYKQIAKTIRDRARVVHESPWGTNLNSVINGKFRPCDMADRLSLVAMEIGSTEYGHGWDVGRLAGKQAERNDFWDVYQQNGQRGSYTLAFGGEGWNAESLKPTHDIIVVGSMSSMFQYSGFEGDLAQHFEDLGITFDSSGATQAHNLFSHASKITRIPNVDISKCGAASSALFTNCYELVTIDGLTVADNNAMTGAFTSCRALVNLTIYGTIGTAGLDLHWSKTLSSRSIESVINALSTTTSGLTVTLSRTAVNNAFETSEGMADGVDSPEWAELIATKPNWTISLV